MFLGAVLKIIFSVSLAFAVTGGEPVNEELSRSIVNVAFARGVCSAVVLSPSVLLVAAHCRDLYKEPLKAAYIQPNIKTPSCDIADVTEYSYEPSAEPNLPFKVHDPDLLMLRLKSPLCSVKPVSLSEKPLTAGDQFWQAGHGGGKKVHGQAYQIQLELIDYSLAKELTQASTKIEQRLLDQSGEAYSFAVPIINHTSACHGDSGGPAFVARADEMSC